jgi:hypothetical protein
VPKKRSEAAILKGFAKTFCKLTKSFCSLPKSFSPFPAIVKARAKGFWACTAINGGMADINMASPETWMEEGIIFSGLANSIGVVTGYFCIVG